MKMPVSCTGISCACPGYEPLEAATGEEALELAYARVPDLILLDMSLPGIDGWEVTAELKRNAITKHIPSWRSPRTRCRPNGSAPNEPDAMAFLPSHVHRPTCWQKSPGCSAPFGRQRSRPAHDAGRSRGHMSNQIEFGRTRSTGLVEVLDRILDKGLFIGGDIKISLAEVELLTIRIRLIVCSLDKAREIGLDWWMYDRHLSPGRSASGERDRLEKRIAALERTLGRRLVVADARPPAARPPKRSSAGAQDRGLR